jgi:hypothetical protein
MVLNAMRGKAEDCESPVLEKFIRERLEQVEILIDQFLLDEEKKLRAPMACGHAAIWWELLPLAEQGDAIARMDVLLSPGMNVVDAKKLKWRCAMCKFEQAQRGDFHASPDPGHTH